jgi:hypothetical protein
VRYVYLSGVGVRQVAYVVVDAMRYLLWFLLAGLVGSGSGWCTGYLSYADWAGANPPPRFRLAEEIRLRRAVLRGVDDIDAYLSAVPRT